MIDGLTYIPNFISVEEQNSLIKELDNLEWSNELKRRTQHFGYKYNYTQKKITKSSYIGLIPEFFNSLLEKLKFKPDQIIANEYWPGQGIHAHVDCIPCFGPVITSVSLLSSCVMDFGYKEQKKSLLLEQLSCLILEKDARYKWNHGIKPRISDSWNNKSAPRDRRVSLTFRYVIL